MCLAFCLSLDFEFLSLYVCLNVGMRKLCKRRLQRKQQKRPPEVAMLELRIPRNRKLGVVYFIAVSNLSFPFVCHVIHCLNLVMHYNLIRLNCQSIRF